MPDAINASAIAGFLGSTEILSRREEEQMTRMHGNEYILYAEKTPRWIPRKIEELVTKYDLPNMLSFMPR
jgi:protein-S-isoprenylcysteine O-methyltransferase Ste14